MRSRTRTIQTTEATTTRPGGRKVTVAIIGAGTCSSELADKAASAGKYVAEHGGVVVCGGLGGVMEGAARGAKEAGGTTIGILPGSDAGAANRYIDYAVATGFGEARNIVIVKTADAVIAFPGEFGTLSEMAFALKLGKPLVSVGAWQLGVEIPQYDDPVEAAAWAMKQAQGA